MMEKIKRDDNRVDIAKLKPDEISGDDLTGGYIVKVDKIDPGFVYGVDGWLSSPSPPYPNAKDIIFQYYYPKVDDIVQQQRNYIEDYITTAESALISPIFADPNNGYQKHFNASSFVDQMILCEMAKEVDQYRFSTYFYKKKDSDGGKLFAGPAWDFNLGYSNVDYWPEGNDYTGWLYAIVEPNEWSIMYWWKRMMEDVYFRNLFKSRWNQLRQNEFSNENFEYAIDSITNYIDEAQQRNYERWPILGEYVWPNYNWQGNDYEDEVAFFENWLFNRISWIDNNTYGTTLNPSAQLSGFYPEIKVTLTDDYFNQSILENKYFTLNNAPSGLTISTVTYLNASQATITLSGELVGSSDISVTINSDILTGFNEITSSTIPLDVENNFNIESNIIVYTSQNNIYLKCSHPELLGNRLEVFNILGQPILTSKIEPLQINNIKANKLRGIYICRFVYNEKIQNRQIIFSN